MRVLISNQPCEGIEKDYERAAHLCLESEGIEPENLEISVAFVSDDYIKELNLTYRGIDSVTDVLSFPQYEGMDEFPESGDIFIGDVVIAPDRAYAQAAEYGHGSKREFVYLFVHSMFHLMGYDHMNDEERAVMREKEEKIMSRLKLERE